MSLRGYLKKLEDRGDLRRVHQPVSRTYEIAGILKKIEPSPTLFEQVTGSSFRVVGNLFCSKAACADYFNISVSQLIPTLARAIENHTPPEVVSSAPCQQVVELHPDLNSLPILRHCERDGGNYISSGVIITRHPDLGCKIWTSTA